MDGAGSVFRSVARLLRAIWFVLLVLFGLLVLAGALANGILAVDALLADHAWFGGDGTPTSHAAGFVLLLIPGLGLPYFGIKGLRRYQGKSHKVSPAAPRRSYWGWVIPVLALGGFAISEVFHRGLGLPMSASLLLTLVVVVAAVAILVLVIDARSRYRLKRFEQKADPALRRMIDETKAAFLPGDGSIVDIQGYWDHITPAPKVRILLADEDVPEGSDLSGLIGRIAAHVGDAIRRDPAFAPYGAIYAEHSSVWATPQGRSPAYARDRSPAEPPETAPLAASGYPFHIRGISGDGHRYFMFDRYKNEETVRRLIGEIPTDTVVVFYDRSYPFPSDPGAYVSFRRVNGAYLHQLHNHGWSTRWKPIDKKKLERYLDGCAWHNRGADQPFSVSMFYYHVEPWNRRWWQVWNPRV